MKCKHCDNDVGEKMTCPYCGQRTNHQYVPYMDATLYSDQALYNSEPNLFMIILAFLVPIFGIIYYFTHVKVVQKKSRVYAISALSSCATSLLVILIGVLNVIF